MEARPNAHLFSFAVLALFIFTFLGGEYHFDIAYGELSSPQAVIGAQAAILAASAVGLIGYSLVNQSASPRIRSVLSAVIGVTSAVLLAATQLATSADALLALGCILFLLLGALGNSAYFLVAQTHFASPILARLVGFSYAAGLLLQFALHAFATTALSEAVVIGVCVLALAALISSKRAALGSYAALPQSEKSDQRITNEHAARTEALLIFVCVVLMACIFSTLDNVVTLANAQGSFDLSTWPRLLLAASGIVAGFVFDLAKSRSTFAMLCVTLLSVVSVVAVQSESEALAGLIVFYLSSGFFVVFFTVSFLRIAVSSSMPSLWAGMGRAANNICAAAIAVPSMQLVTSGNRVLTCSVAMGLFVAILAAAHALENLRRKERHESELRALELARAAKAAEASRTREEETTPEDHLAAFAERCGLTPRERDVLAAVCGSEDTLQSIADEMGFSLRSLQKHLTSIYRKSQTQSRAGLCSAALTEPLPTEPLD